MWCNIALKKCLNKFLIYILFLLIDIICFISIWEKYQTLKNSKKI